MVLINFMVTGGCKHPVLLPWHILSVHEPEESFNSLFDRVVKPKILDKLSHQSSEVKLDRCYVGQSKDAVDKTDSSLLVEEVVSAFGPYIKIFVSVHTESVSLTHNGPVRNAFDVLMQASRDLSLPDVPSRIPARSRKDDLYNAIIDLFEEINLILPCNDANSSGKRLVKALCNVLWYIDGLHETLSARSCPVPDIFSKFQGYNKPEMSKHRKRQHTNLNEVELRGLASELFVLLLNSFWKLPVWSEFKVHVEATARSLVDYADYLSNKNKKMKIHHSQTTPARQIAENLSISFFPASASRSSLHADLNQALEGSQDFNMIDLSDFCPPDPRQKYRYIQRMSEGLCAPIALLTFSAGGNIGNISVVWKMPNTSDNQMSLCLPVIEHFKQNIPEYHTRAMKKALFTKFGRIAPSVKPAHLRYFYRELTGDASASTHALQAAIDSRIKLFIDMEDPNVVCDLRALNSSSQRVKYDRFWEECDAVLNEEVGVAVDDRRHTEITHLATAISVRDLWERVRKRLPDGTNVPGQEWLRLQFWPKTKHAKASLHYTGKLKVRFMIQQRQFRKQHQHYAAAVFRYQRECCLKYRAFSTFVCLDDKHRIKVGEPGFPVAAAERGRRVVVSMSKSFQVGDHDFTKFSVIPSVILILNIPPTISDSWYDGKVYVGVKDAVFQQSSPIRHVCELSSVLEKHWGQNISPILFLYTDGGPDHRLTYISVQLSLISLFLKYDLDFLCAARTAPCHSWRNPVERIMSVLNLALQCIGMMRREMPGEYEKASGNCGNMGELRIASEKVSGFKDAVETSLSPCILLLCDLFHRVGWKDNKLESFFAASDSAIEEFWKVLLDIDSSLESYSYTRKTIKTKDDMLKFIDHCCQQRTYVFSVKKCFSSSCSICSPPRLPQDIYQSLYHLPDPMLSDTESGHYKPFNDVYGKATTEKDLPSKKATATASRRFTLKHVKNANLMLQCEECDLWRLVYSDVKLTPAQKSLLQNALADSVFTCGSSIEDLDLELENVSVYTQPLNCNEPIEKQYYSAGYKSICVYCACDQSSNSSASYPQCSDCSDKDPVPKK